MTRPRRRGPPAPRTVGEWWRDLERRFAAARLAFGHGTHNARDEAAWLVCSALGIGFGALDGALARPVAGADARRLASLARRRIETRAPLAYLLREAWLQDHRFYVDARVIVPRSHIAELLPAGLAPWLAGRPVRRILDLCTGSGCLAILAALAYPRASVDASDVSAAALAVARRNVADYGLAPRVRLARSDLFAALADARYDLILSNPPYVTRASMRALPREYRHEPRLALAGGRDGLDVVRRIVAGAADRLAEDGVLVVEIGAGRRVLERAFPRTPFTWLRTTGADDGVFLLRRAELPPGFRGEAKPDAREVQRRRARGAASQRKVGP
ncbi:MAG: 50S ribosomal protein L3 N(5)-glutamine methyltransferase [Burkholderiales bacterium]|nr:50S ribosomal protein L3 N(5)-glutamine methyltransferase [Burkholderiales bacterium]